MVFGLFPSVYIPSISDIQKELGKTLEYVIISFKLVSLLKLRRSEYNFTILPVSNGCQKAFLNVLWNPEILSPKLKIEKLSLFLLYV